MKKLPLLLLFLSLTNFLLAQRINEIHYDNISTDVGQFVEVFIPDPQPTGIANYNVELYTGSTGNTYNTLLFGTDATAYTGIDGSGTMGSFYVFLVSLQNDDEAIALVDASGTALQFISYEGIVTANNGAALGMISIDIGVTESNSTTSVGSSLEYNVSLGIWEKETDDSPGSANTTCGDGIKNGDEVGIDCGGSCVPCTVVAYYACTETSIQSGTECTMLKTDLHNLIKDHTVLDYYEDTAEYDLLEFICDYDMRLNDAGVTNIIWDVYSDNPSGTEAYEYPCGNIGSGPSGEGQGYQREHILPSSWWGGGNSISGFPQYYDFHNLLPADAYVNLQKSNHCLGETSSPTFTSTNGTKVGSPDNGCGGAKIFEPIDEYKGDFARSYMYMAVRYEDIIASWEPSTANSMAALDGTNYTVFEPCLLSMLLTWHENDPVSPKELSRNDAIYGKQGNRNPFIDHPEYAAYIWGDSTGTPCSDATPRYIAAKVYLQGPLSGTTMNVQLSTNGVLPNSEPYSALAFTGLQNAGANIASSAIAATGGDAIVDWVIIELRAGASAATATTVVARRAALLQADGDVVGENGGIAVGFENISAGNYYIAIRHRNHLGVMTQNPVSVN